MEILGSARLAGLAVWIIRSYPSLSPETSQTTRRLGTLCGGTRTRELGKPPALQCRFYGFSELADKCADNSKELGSSRTGVFE